MWRVWSLAHQGKIGMATSTVVHVGLVIAGLAMTAPDLAPHFHLRQGAIELEGSFAASMQFESAVAEESPNESESEPVEFVAKSPSPALPEPKPTELARATEPLLLEAEMQKLADAVAVCDCPASEHGPQTLKRQSAEAPKEPIVDTKPELHRAETVAQVSAQVSASEASLPATSEPAGSQLDQPPTLAIANRPPPYPADAYRLGKQGRVLLEVQVTTQGVVESLRILESSGDASLDKSALETVRTWRFEPARRGGRAVAGALNVPVRFAIRAS